MDEWKKESDTVSISDEVINGKTIRSVAYRGRRICQYAVTANGFREPRFNVKQVWKDEKECRKHFVLENLKRSLRSHCSAIYDAEMYLSFLHHNGASEELKEFKDAVVAVPSLDLAMVLLNDVTKSAGIMAKRINKYIKEDHEMAEELCKTRHILDKQIRDNMLLLKELDKYVDENGKPRVSPKA